MCIATTGGTPQPKKKLAVAVELEFPCGIKVRVREKDCIVIDVLRGEIVSLADIKNAVVTIEETLKKMGV